jgi:hypothetical protein
LRVFSVYHDLNDALADQARVTAAP